jgi:sugar lactone lactonase YvrE
MHSSQRNGGIMTNAGLRALPAEGAILTESPVWFDETRTLAWVDMVAGTISTASERGELSRIAIAPYLGAIVPTRSGGLAAVTVDGLGLVVEGGLEPMVKILTDPSVRLNDAACDAEGRLWVGSTAFDATPGAGALHVWDGNGLPRVAVEGLTQPNGIGWSPDLTTMYVVDTAVSTVYFVEVVRDGGIGELQTFIQLGNDQPDGLCVDSEGCLWIAMWDGAEVRRYSPAGEFVEALALPVTRPTSCALSGDGRLYITTARHGLTEQQARQQEWAGRVLELRVGVLGAPVGRLAV